MSNDSSSSGGIGFLGLLAIVFIVLKLCGVLGWSWWYVTAPIWGPSVLGLSCLLLYITFISIGGSFLDKKE